MALPPTGARRSGPRPAHIHRRRRTNGLSCGSRPLEPLGAFGAPARSKAGQHALRRAAAGALASWPASAARCPASRPGRHIAARRTRLVDPIVGAVEAPRLHPAAGRGAGRAALDGDWGPSVADAGGDPADGLAGMERVGGAGGGDVDASTQPGLSARCWRRHSTCFSGSPAPGLPCDLASPGRGRGRSMSPRGRRVSPAMSPEPLTSNRTRALATASAVFLVLLNIYLLTFQGVFRVDDEHILAARAQSLALWGRLEQPQAFGNQRERELQAMGTAATQIEPAQAVLGAGLYSRRVGAGLGRHADAVPAECGPDRCYGRRTRAQRRGDRFLARRGGGCWTALRPGHVRLAVCHNLLPRPVGDVRFSAGNTWLGEDHASRGGGGCRRMAGARRRGCARCGDQECQPGARAFLWPDAPSVGEGHRAELTPARVRLGRRCSLACGCVAAAPQARIAGAFHAGLLHKPGAAFLRQPGRGDAGRRNGGTLREPGAEPVLVLPAALPAVGGPAPLVARAARGCRRRPACGAGDGAGAGAVLPAAVGRSGRLGAASDAADPAGPDAAHGAGNRPASGGEAGALGDHCLGGGIGRRAALGCPRPVADGV